MKWPDVLAIIKATVPKGSVVTHEWGDMQRQLSTHAEFEGWECGHVWWPESLTAERVAQEMRDALQQAIPPPVTP